MSSLEFKHPGLTVELCVLTGLTAEFKWPSEQVPELFWQAVLTNMLTGVFMKNTASAKFFA